MAEYIIEQCRTCLGKQSDLVSLEADHVVCDKVMSVIDLLKTCTSVQIELDDGYPQFVCVECIRSAEKAYEFRVQCEKTDQTLRTQVTSYEILEFKNDITIEDTVIECEEDLDNKGTFDNDEIEHDDVSIDENEEEIHAEEMDIFEDSESIIKCEEVDVQETKVQDGFSCAVCHLIYPTQTALVRHSHTKHPPNFFQCSHCPTRWISRHLLDEHLKKHISQDAPFSNKTNNETKRKRTVEFICAVCGKQYTSLVHLQIHVRKHEKIKSKSTDTFICQECDHHFDSAANLQTHMESLHNFKTEKHKSDSESNKHDKNDNRKKRTGTNNVSYKCKICSSIANSLSEMKDHLSTHNIDSKLIFQYLLYKCVQCQKDFRTIYEYFRHISQHETTEKSENLSNSGGTRVFIKRPYKCSVAGCEKAFPTPSALRNHARSHESHWPKKCKHCDTVVERWHDYMIHLNEKHDAEKTFVCQQCGKKFFKERNLQSHIKTHSGERNYMCDFCGFSFHAQNNLVAHRRIHLGVKPYKCTYCPQAFSQHAGLRSHLLNHTGEKKYECPTCHKKFLRIGAMKTHIKTHTGVKDYVCHICGARFGASSTRKKHLLTHTGERNHVCDFCGKAFSRRSNLNVHRKIHTGETPHVCEVCGKGFIQAHVLRSHMNTHRKPTNVESGKKSTRYPRRAVMKKNLNETALQDENDVEELTVLVDLAE